MTALLWFRRDLRVTDHPGLYRAAAGPVLPVYIADPSVWAGPEASARQWDFVAECLATLREDLAALGVPLIVRQGDPVEVLARLARAHGVTTLVTLGDPADPRVAAWARAAGIDWQILAPTDPAAPVAGLTGPAVAPGPIPTARGLGLAPDACPHRQPGGRGAGLLRLAACLDGRAGAAALAPHLAERTASRLSPHLAWGTLSAQEVAAAIRAAQPADPQALRQLQARLARRRGQGTPMPVAGAATAPLQAWAQGETGLPFLDACLRYLRATGWLNFPMRQMVLATATGLLGLDAGACGRHLARTFTDYDPAIHWRQVAAARRRGDPIRQGLALDPDGAFTRRWLPELAEVPPPFLHMPWRWSGAGKILGRRYPEPLACPPLPKPPAPPRGRPGGAQLCLDL